MEQLSKKNICVRQMSQTVYALLLLLLY